MGRATRTATTHRGGTGDVFDVHLHAFSDTTPFEAIRALDFGALRKFAGTPIIAAERLMEETLAHMDEHRVRVGLVSGDRDPVLRWAAAHPDRFLASFRPDLEAKDPTAAAAAFEDEVEEGKWRAMGELTLPYEGRRLDDAALFPYYEVCERHALPVTFHTGLDGPAPHRGSPHFRVEFGDPLLLQDVVNRFPDLRLIVAHMGWPFFDHALYLLYAYPNVYLDTGVVDWILGPSVFRRMVVEAVDTCGSDRLLFGTDQMAWPQMIGPALNALQAIDELSREDRRRILWSNAAELIPMRGGD